MPSKQKQLSQAALAVLGSIDLDGGVARITGGQLDRPIYLEVNAALESLGGTWNRKAKGHVFTQPEDAHDRLESLVTAGVFVRAEDVKRTLGWFATPAKVAQRVQQLAGVATLKKGACLLEPSAGEGALLSGLDEDRLKVIAVELDPTRAEKLRLHSATWAVYTGDFLAMTQKQLFGPFDRVLMNPTFQRQADLDHVRHAFTMLKPGGRLVAILSAALTYRANAKTKAFREEVLDPHGEIVEELPHGTFHESGTDVSAVIVQLDR